MVGSTSVILRRARRYGGECYAHIRAVYSTAAHFRRLIDGVQTSNSLVPRVLASGHTSGSTGRAQSRQLLPEEFPLLQRGCMGSLAGREG